METAETLVFWWKIKQNLKFVYLLCPKTSRNDCRKTLIVIILTREKLVEENCRNPCWTSFVVFFQFEYKMLSHFNDLVLDWTSYLKYVHSFKEFDRSTWVNNKLIFYDKPSQDFFRKINVCELALLKVFRGKSLNFENLFK